MFTIWASDTLVQIISWGLLEDMTLQGSSRNFLPPLKSKEKAAKRQTLPAGQSTDLRFESPGLSAKSAKLLG